ncbi:MAG: glycosyltransferase family 4 protein [Candidatus Woesearchaeota archaeon]
MIYQFANRSVPDLKFFGNTFILLALAKFLRESIIIANKRSEIDTQTQINISNLLNIIYRNYPKGNIKTREEDILHFHFPESDVFCVDNFQGTKVMHLHIFPGYDDKDDEKYVSSLIEQQKKGNISHFIAVSNSVAERYSSFIPQNKLTVIFPGVYDIYNPIGQKKRIKIRQHLGLSSSFLFGFLGRLDTRKGYYDLLEILKFFNENKKYDVSFVISTTSGTHLVNFDRDIKNCAFRLAEENRIRIIPDISKYSFLFNYNPEIIEYFINIFSKIGKKTKLYQGITTEPMPSFVDCVIHPAWTEPFGLSPLESICSGTPVIAYNVGGIPEFLNDERGYLLPYSDQSIRVKKFIEAMIAAYESERKIVLPSEVRRGYSVNEMCLRTQEIYNKL